MATKLISATTSTPAMAGSACSMSFWLPARGGGPGHGSRWTTPEVRVGELDKASVVSHRDMAALDLGGLAAGPILASRIP